MASPNFRKLVQVLEWCLPALLVGAILRGLLIWAMPFAYVQHDSVRLLVAGAEWLPGDTYELFTGNVPFLVPALYRLALRGPIPGLVTIELMQHLAGLLVIVMGGLLVRFWCARWKWWIVPATMLFAIHPSLLWYEHTVMLETPYVVAAMTLAVAVTWFLRHASQVTFVAVGAAVWLVAATRPEGKLFLLVPVLALPLAFYGKWRELAKGALTLVATVAAVGFVSVAGESGLLLYSSVIHLSPEVSKRYPETAPYVASMRTQAIEDAKRGPAFVSRPQRVALTAALRKYVDEHPNAGRGATPDQRLNAVAKSMAFETCIRRPWPLVPLAFQKFRFCADELANGFLSATWLHERQLTRLHNSWSSLQPQHRALYGRDFANNEQLDAFIQAAFLPERTGWFDRWCDAWEKIYSRHFRDTKYPSGKLPGLPYFYLLAMAGVLLCVLRSNPARTFHVCWGVMLAALWFIVMVTANERPRFRFVFEPFFFLYALLAIALVTEWVRGRMRRESVEQS